MNSNQKTSKQIILVTGAARSGKSEWAETLATGMDNSIIYLATAQIKSEDQEWYLRIQKHQQRRPSSWQTVEVPIELVAAINHWSLSGCLLIDSLGTWVANLLEQSDEAWQKNTTKLLESLIMAKTDVILVAEETGWGVVPAYETGRKFRDRLGDLSRQIGAIADSVYLVTGGHVLNLSLLGEPLP